MKNPFKAKPDIEFIDTTHNAFARFPIMRASEVKPLCYEKQKEKFGKVKFPNCPGMIDYARMGYIIPAWADIHILANKAGVSFRLGCKSRGSKFAQGKLMDSSIIEGVMDVEDDVPLTPLHFAAPWSVFAKEGVSALVMPAIYHSDFLDDLMVLPGVVDYGKFHAINFICVQRKACKIKIPAGSPLMHVIPVYATDIKANYGPANIEQMSLAATQMYTGEEQAYRKLFQYVKRFTLSLIGNNPEK